MTIHSIHEAAIVERQEALGAAYTAALDNKTNPALREEYIRLAAMELVVFTNTVGLENPIELVNSGRGGAFDELVDLYNTRGAGISEALYCSYLTANERTIVDAYPKLGFDLDIEYVEGSKLGVDVVSFDLEVPVPVSAQLYCISAGKKSK